MMSSHFCDRVFGNTSMMGARLTSEVPATPGDVVLAGRLPADAGTLLAMRSKSWICMLGPPAVLACGSLSDWAESTHEQEKLESERLRATTHRFADRHKADSPATHASSLLEVRLGPPEETAEDKAFRKAMQSSVHWETLPFSSPTPSPGQAEAVLEALDRLPRPIVVQCASGNRAGAAVLLWLARKRGYSAASAQQLATDMDLKFFTQCSRCGPMREWLGPR